MTDVSILIKALRSCESQFNDYANQHMAKNTDEGDAKALTNRRLARMCNKAIQDYELAQPVEMKQRHRNEN